jgi:RNA polymerase sigma-70 factor, ECF subfamily
MVPEELEAERLLVARLRKSDRRAFQEFVTLHEGPIYRLAWRLVGTGADAEDLAQDVFLQFFRTIEAYRGEAQLKTWLYRITINLAKNRQQYWARRQRKDHTELDETHSDAQASGLTAGEVARPDQEALGHELEKIVLECLRQLDADSQHLLVLRDIEGLPYEEICAIADMALGTLKSRLHRARTELRELVEQRREEKIR